MVQAAASVVIDIDIDVPVGVDVGVPVADVVYTGAAHIIGTHVAIGVIDLLGAATTPAAASRPTAASTTTITACLYDRRHGEAGQNENRQGCQKQLAECFFHFGAPLLIFQRTKFNSSQPQQSKQVAALAFPMP